MRSWREWAIAAPSKKKAVYAIEARLGVTGSTDANSVTYQLSRVVPQLPHRSGGLYFVHSATGAATGSNALTVNTLYAIPFYVPETVTYASVGIIRTVSVVGAYEHLGVYSDNGGVPDALLFDWGITNPAADVAETGFKSITPVPASSLTAGWVWLCCVPQVAVNTLFATVGTSTGAPVVLGTSTPSATGMTMGYAGTTTSTSLPASWGSTYTERSVVPLVYVARS